MIKNLRKAFTIIELVIVIAIIAVLAAVMIPTFSNLIKKANLSADMVAVKEMNTILATEDVSNKPVTVVDAQNVLKANGVNDFTAMSTNNEFYWLCSENRVILWEWENDKKISGMVTYPAEYVKKYGDVTTPSVAWAILNATFDNTKYIEIQYVDGESLKTTVINAIQNAPDGAIIKLPENSNLELSKGGLYWLAEALKIDNQDIGKSITIDLNGSMLNSSGTNAIFTFDSNGKPVINEKNEYVYNILNVPANAELVLKNGYINIEHGNYGNIASIIAHSGSKLVISNVVMNTSTAGIMPNGDASEVVIENSTINACNYPLGTNRSSSSNIKITVNNSNLSASDNVAVLINTTSYTHIYNSTITGIKQGIVLRTGYLIVENSTIITKSTNPSIYSYKDFAYSEDHKDCYGFGGWWQSGNTLPGGTIVLGDYAKDKNGIYSYSGDVTCELINTKLQSALSSAIPEVLLAASDPAKKVLLTYDVESTIGNVKVYGEDWDPAEDSANKSVTINQQGTIKVNDVEKKLN